MRNNENTILYHSNYNQLVVVRIASLPAGADWYTTWNQMVVNFMMKLKKMEETQKYDNFNDLSKLLIPWCGNAFVL